MHSPTVNGIQMHKIKVDSHAKTNYTRKMLGLLVISLWFGQSWGRHAKLGKAVLELW
jgi:hypothetical protein